MLLPLKIALRYLFARKSHSAVNVISVVSIAGVAVATAAIVVVMSVFNGFTRLAASHLSLIDPQLKVVPAKGKVITDGDSLAAAISQVEGVDCVVPLLSERALLDGAGRQMPVVMTGVGDKYALAVDIDSTIIDGVFTTAMIDSLSPMQISVGVAMTTGLRPSFESLATVYTPKRKGRINPANPAGAFRSADFVVTGVMRVDQPEYDNDHVILPIATARKLLDYYGSEASALAVRLDNKADIKAVDTRLKQMLGPDMEVLTRLEQQAEAFRMIAIEKWITFLMLAFIMVIASFNIISTLSLLVIEKRDNMATMRALGAPYSMLRRIFMYEGALVTVIGGVVGIAIGMCLSLAQEHYGFIKLSGDPSTLNIDAYPVAVEWPDAVAVMGIVCLVAVAASFIGALLTKRKGQ